MLTLFLVEGVKVEGRKRRDRVDSGRGSLGSNHQVKSQRKPEVHEPVVKPSNLFFLKEKTFYHAQETWWISLITDTTTYEDEVLKLRDVLKETRDAYDWLINRIEERQNSTRNRDTVFLLKKHVVDEMMNRTLYSLETSLKEIHELNTLRKKVSPRRGMQTQPIPSVLAGIDVKDLPVSKRSINMDINDPEVNDDSLPIEGSQNYNSRNERDEYMELSGENYGTLNPVFQDTLFKSYENEQLLDLTPQTETVKMNSNVKTKVTPGNGNDLKMDSLEESSGSLDSDTTNVTLESVLYSNFSILQVEVPEVPEEYFQVFHNRVKRAVGQLLRKPRVKRKAPFEFIGNLLANLLGLLNQKQFKTVNKQIAALAETMRELRSVYQEGMVIMNSTDLSVKMVDSKLKGLERYLDNVENKWAELYHEASRGRRYDDYENYLMNIVFMIYLSAEDMQHQILNTKRKVGMLLDHRLTPEVLPPTVLREVWQNISSVLPKGIYLPYDSHTELLDIYRAMTTVSISHSEGILTILAIPLVNTKLAYDLYRVVNIAVFLPFSNLTAQYDLEHEVFAVSQDHNYVLFLDKDDYLECKQSGVEFCPVNKALFHTNTLQNDCLMRVFMSQNKLDMNCPVKFKNSTKEIQAQYLYKGKWIISVSYPVSLRKVCNGEYIETVTIYPSVHVIQLSRNCMLISDSFQLLPYVFGETQVEIIKPTVSKFGNISIWRVVTELLDTDQRVDSRDNLFGKINPLI